MFKGTFHSMDEAYAQLVCETVETGFEATPRGKRCWEMRPATFTIRDPRSALYSGRSRRLNLRFLAIETLSYIAGWGDRRHADLMLAVNPKLDFALDRASGVFYGAYGPRLVRSMEEVCARLKADTWSRQCFASIWEPGLPPRDCLDTPCTMGLSFYAEPSHPSFCMGRPDQPVLSMTAVMRSNDLNWGTPYDVAAFAAIQVAAAEVAGLPPGRYNHYASSLHVYAEGQPDGGPEGMPQVVLWQHEEWAPSVRLPRDAHGFGSWDELAAECDDLLFEVWSLVNAGDGIRTGLQNRDNPWLQHWVRMIRQSKRLYDDGG